MIIVSIDERSESQYVNKMSSKNSSIDSAAWMRGLLNKRKDGGKQETEKERKRQEDILRLTRLVAQLPWK